MRTFLFGRLAIQFGWTHRLLQSSLLRSQNVKFNLSEGLLKIAGESPQFLHQLLALKNNERVKSYHRSQTKKKSVCRSRSSNLWIPKRRIAAKSSTALFRDSEPEPIKLLDQ